MESINKLYYTIVVAVISFVIGLIVNQFSFPLQETGSILTGIMVFIFLFNDTDTVDINEKWTYKNRFNGKLVGSKPEGTYWTRFYSFHFYSAVNISKNRYDANPIVDTKNNIRGEQPFTMWAYVEDALKNQRVGTDVSENIITDLEDSMKDFATKKTDIDLRKLQGSKIDLFTIVEENNKDSLWETLRDAGIYFDKNDKTNKKNPVINMGTFVLPQVIIDANLAVQATKRNAEQRDFDTKEISKNVDNILINTLLPYIKNERLSPRMLRKLAIEELETSTPSIKAEDYPGDNEHYFEQLLAGEMISILIDKLPGEDDKDYISPEELKELRQNAETTFSVRQGRTQDIKGLENSNARAEIQVGQNTKNK
jgi:hypothetical protein